MHVPNPVAPIAGLRGRLDRPWPRRLLRIAGWLAVAVYFAVALLVLALRHLVLPGIENYRGDIEGALSGAIARPVTIRAIEARWQGFWPNLQIHGLDIRDAQGRPALGFDLVEADLAWSSLWHLSPRLARLEIVAPTLDVRRDAQGRLFIAGLEVDTQSQDSGFSSWLLDQDRIVIRDAAVTWHDDQRGAPALKLAHLSLDLRNSGSHHRFGVTAEPPQELATRLDIRGDFRGADINRLETWKGESYAELDYADLAGWQAWVDYPVELPRGGGALRLWLGFANKTIDSVTADVRVANLAVRLGADLPMLELDRLDGRLFGRRLADGFAGGVKHLALAARGGIGLEPTDLSFQWRPSAANRLGHGEVAANGLDLGALAALAGYLPLDPALRQKLAAYGPSGRVFDLKLSWSGEPGLLKTYSLQSRFEDLGLLAQGPVPGFAGLDGRIEGNEKGGALDLASRDVQIDLPAVFSERRMELATLNARAHWRIEDGLVDVQLERAAFDNADAAGEAGGHYRGDGNGPGEIDLAAKLTRASGAAVWRYMPLVVNQTTRDWLRNSIIGGAATATLRLKGDLNRFPFKDGSGIFEVKGPFHGAGLNYANGWPQFDDVAGDLEFAGARMTIRAQRAKLWGVALENVKAEIADLESPEELMVITGAARGPTADFLRYIEASPVGNRIDHFTEDMTAKGAGELHLRLDMPLRHVIDTRVDGRYRFNANSLVVDPDMPPLTEVNGEIHFTGDKLEAQRIRAMALGAPMTVDLATQDGKVAVKAAGSMDVRSLRQQFGHPAFDYLSGVAPWTGTVRVRKKDAEVRIESSLKGISSSLPEPFNKTAADAMPLVFERKPPPEPPKGRRQPVDKTPVARDQLAFSLGDALKVQLVRRHDGDKAVVERGVIAVGKVEPRLPERGVALLAQAKRLDTDFWRRLANGNGAGGTALGINQLDIRADEFVAFGRSLNDFRLAGAQEGGTWALDLKSRDASGNLKWNGEGAGKLTAHFAQLAFNESLESKLESKAADSPEQLPAINLTVDRLLLKGRSIGAVSVDAHNEKGVWNAQFEVKNEDGGLSGSGRWRPDPVKPETQLDFKLEAKSVEKMLGRAGYPEAVKRGNAALEGNLAWAGAPTGLDYGSLSGYVKVDARDGQFRKLEPGVGRLLGILSLQSLPRRLTLDFNDVFSEGFAFDSIEGRADVSRGVLDTRNLVIKGPSATVRMAGTVDLVKETQDLKVRVQPAVTQVATTAAALIHPAAIVVWGLDYLFGHPFDKALAFDYTVTGAWADPKVEKVTPSVKDAKPAGPNLP